MSKTTIADTRIRLRPTKQLIRLLAKHKDKIAEVPTNIAKALKSQGYSLPDKIEILQEDTIVKSPKIDTQLLNDLIAESAIKELPVLADRPDEVIETEDEKTVDNFFYLNDLRWLNNFLITLRQDADVEIFLHNVIETCELILPENEVIARNPELEARCQKLREEQENLQYRKMTKNVDATLKHYPEDTIAYQMKALNSQIIAVLQFVFSVVAGFVFGFLGVQLIVGNLDFGFRLLLGIICALVIALAEIYFLAKKLSEYDNTVDSLHFQAPKKGEKVHKD